MWNTEERRKIHRKVRKNNLKAMGPVNNRIILKLTLKKCDERMQTGLTLHKNADHDRLFCQHDSGLLSSIKCREFVYLLVSCQRKSTVWGELFNFQLYLQYSQVCRQRESIICRFQGVKADPKHVANGISPIMRCASWPVTKLKKERPDLCSRNDANIVIIIVIISSLRIAFAVDAELTCVGCYFTKLSSLYINSVLCFSRMKNLLLRIEAIFQFLLGQNVKNEVLFSILLS